MPPASSSVNSALRSLPATPGSGLWALEDQVWSGGNWHPDTFQALRPRRQEQEMLTQAGQAGGLRSRRLTPSAGAWLRAAGPAVGPRLQVSRAPHPPPLPCERRRAWQQAPPCCRSVCT